MAITEQTPGKSPALVRAIGRWSLAALLLNSIIGSGIFGLPSVIAGLVGRDSVFAYLVAAAGMGLIMACFAEVASRFTAAGGPYLYARAAFGRFAGIEMGWLSWLVRITASAAGANLFVIYLVGFWPQAGQPVFRFLVLTLLLGILVAVNYRGVKSGTQLSNFFTVAKLLPLAIFIFAGLLYLVLGHRSGSSALPVSSPGNSQWMQAVLLLVFAYGGFEAGLMPMAEAKNPRRDAPFALFVALLTCTLVYTLIQVVVMGTLPDPTQSERPLAAAARYFLGDFGSTLISLGALVSLYGYLGSMMLNSPRLTFALAECGDFPAFFAAVHPRYRTPHLSIVFFGILVWAMAIWGNFRWNVTLSAVARLFAYGVVCAALPVLRRKQPGGAAFRLPGGQIFVLLGIAFSLLLATRMGRSELEILSVTAVVALLNWIWTRRSSALVAFIKTMNVDR